MKVFVSYSFRPENAWVENLVIPLIACFGHEPLTGQILEAQPLPDAVKAQMRKCRRIVCFTTRASERFDQQGQLTGYDPPPWVVHEFGMALGAGQSAIEFKEKGVVHRGAAAFFASHEFDRSDLSALLLRMARVLKDWPVMPLQLRLSIPDTVQAEFEAAHFNNALSLACSKRDMEDDETDVPGLRIHQHDGHYIIPLWEKIEADEAISVKIGFGNRRLVCDGVSPSACLVPLKLISQ